MSLDRQRSASRSSRPGRSPFRADHQKLRLAVLGSPAARPSGSGSSCRGCTRPARRDPDEDVEILDRHALEPRSVDVDRPGRGRERRVAGADRIVGRLGPTADGAIAGSARRPPQMASDRPSSSDPQATGLTRGASGASHRGRNRSNAATTRPDGHDDRCRTIASRVGERLAPSAAGSPTDRPSPRPASSGPIRAVRLIGPAPARGGS